MPRPRLQRAATARREKVQLRIREQSFIVVTFRLSTEAIVALAKNGCVFFFPQEEGSMPCLEVGLRRALPPLLPPCIPCIEAGLRRGAKALLASCPASLLHKSLYSKLMATLDRTTTNIDRTP
jgi:hypothetical protein